MTCSRGRLCPHVDHVASCPGPPLSLGLCPFPNNTPASAGRVHRDTSGYHSKVLLTHGSELLPGLNLKHDF